MEALYYLFALLLISVGLAQAALLPHIRIFGQHLDLMLVVVVAWSLLRGVRQGLIWALMGGLVLDTLSGAPFGVFTAALVGASLVSSAGAASFFRSHEFLPSLAVTLATITYFVVSVSLLWITGRRFAVLDMLRQTVLPSLGLNLALMFAVFPAIRWLHRNTAQREMEW